MERGNILVTLLVFTIVIMLASIAFLIYTDFYKKFTVDVDEISKDVKEIHVIKEVLKPEPIKISNPAPQTKVEVAIASTTLENKIFDMINQQREIYNLEPVQLDTRIAQVSRAYSKKMYDEDFINHTDLQGNDFVDRFGDVGIYYLCVGENLFLIENFSPGTDIAKSAVEGWMNSKGHRENILNQEYTHAGVGVHCQDNKCLATQNFACLTTTLTDNLQKRFIYFFPLYAEDIEFNTTAQVDLNLTSNKKLDVYLVPDKQQQENLARKKDFQYFEFFSRVETLTVTTFIQKNNGLVIIPHDDAEITLSLIYS